MCFGSNKIKKKFPLKFTDLYEILQMISCNADGKFSVISYECHFQ